MVVWLFPGQGSQRRGMGDGLFDRHRDLVAAADAELGYSIAELCRDDPDGRLRDTAYAQPALFVVEALTFLDRAGGEPPPKFLAGHSLGEYAALFAAGCFDFTTGVRLVRRRGELMGRASGGGMLAVLGVAADAVRAALRDCGRDDLDIANHNADDQVVLSGPEPSLQALADHLRERGTGRTVPLKVSAAFHSRYMAPAAEAFGEYLAGFEFADPALPVIANVTAQPYGPGAVARLLTAQIHQPVRWSQSLRLLLDQGVTEAVELGPGTVLAGLWRAARRAHAAAGAAAEPVVRAAAEPVVRAAAEPVDRTAAEPVDRTAAEPVVRAPAQRRDRAPAEPVVRRIGPETLGSADFRRDYGIRYAYLAGAMYHGIASTELVVRLGRAGLMGFFGAGGLRVEQVDQAITVLRRELGDDGRYGMNLLCTLDNPDLERTLVEHYLRAGVRFVEAAAYPQVTAPLVRWRCAGAHRDRTGRPVARNHVLAKVSRPEVATAFMSPPPPQILDRLVADGLLTRAEAEAGGALPISDDVCVEADSAGHTDGGVALTLLPSMMRLRDELMRRHGYPGRIRIGAAGGLGAPEALAAVFVLGVDFVVTGSINQCCPQAGTSDEVKEMLAGLDVQDTGYAPAGDLFELGAKVQVARKGTLFAARANKLYQVYRQYPTLEDIAPATRRVIEEDYFGRTFAQIWAETSDYLAERHPAELARAERDPRRRMLLVFRWYFRHSTDVAMRGDPTERVNYQVHCGPAMGAFNRWVKGTDLQDWRRRSPEVIGERLMGAAAELLDARLRVLADSAPAPAQH